MYIVLTSIVAERHLFNEWDSGKNEKQLNPRLYSMWDNNKFIWEKN